MAESKATAVEEAAREDLAGLVELRRACMPHVAATPNLLAWQWLDNPSGQARIYVIRDRGRIVSMYQAIQQRVRFGGAVRAARMIQDVMTLPDYRGRGYLHAQAWRCLDDMTAAGEVGYTFPNQQSERSFRRTGWIELGRVPLRTRTIAPAAPAAPQGPRVVLREVDRFDEAATRIWQQSGLPCGVHRDAEYLNWRYRKPDCHYARFIVGDNAGILVLKRYAEGDRVIVHICELVAPADAGELVTAALAAAEHHAQRLGTSELTCWLPAGHPHEPAYEAAGFGLQQLDRYIFATANDAGGLPTDSSAWHFSQGDSDVY
ncbi:MAG: GNAT family N-acetyltransferase [Betaproteobacteria bacterium]|nr:GNAT family N-acetyltransferase [Betaproteobacteria bacterium]